MVESGDLSAVEAAARLGISRATLYAYVSRGMIRSYPGMEPRERRYSREDVERLKSRQLQRQQPGTVMSAALDWGAPLLESHLTLIRDGQLYYRGYNAVELARQRAFEQVAALLWTGVLPDEAALFPRHPAPRAALGLAGAMRNLTPVQRFQAALPLLAASDEAGLDTRPAAVIRSGGRIVRQFAALLSGGDQDLPVATLLQRGLAPADQRVAALLNMALTLCCDHELNISAFTARCVASAGASPYEVATAGLSALSGVRHGGQTERVVALLREVERPELARMALAERLRRGDAIPGFGHRLYPAGDPRAKALLAEITALFPEAPVAARAQALCDAAQTLLGERPTIDLGLAALAEILAAPAGTALAIFALGRMVGWIAHALEEYGLGRLIRPRAAYIGVEPPR